MNRKTLSKEEIENKLNNNNFVWNDGYWVEGIDRVNSVHEIINALLCPGGNYHPAIVRAKMEKDFDKVLEDVYDLYTTLSQVSDDER